MKKTLSIVVLIIFCSFASIYSQQTYPGGTPIGRIFANYKYSLNQDDDLQGFGVDRAWLGYKYFVNENFSAQVIIDIGSPLSTENVSSKRYSFLRNALVSYKKDKLTLTVGLTDARSAETELKLWAKRYLSIPFILNYEFVNIADLGIVVDYEISPLISIDAAILNGEGYTGIESDNSLLYGFGISINPIEGLVLRAYADTYKREDATKNTISTIAGYQHKRFTVAIGYNYKTDFDWTDGHNTGGITTFGAFNLTEKTELFGRFDLLKSVVLDGETEAWNILDDGSLIVAGIQHKFLKQIKGSINYQGWRPASSGTASWNYIQANLEFRF